MKRVGLTDIEYKLGKKITKREEFLHSMDKFIP